MTQAISGGHEQTIAVAKEILLAGGNAFDAAIAAHVAMFITEPLMASAGGAGFAVTSIPGSKPQFFDFFCQTPELKHYKKSQFTPIEVQFSDDTETFYIGLGSTAVPGTVAGLFELHKSLGSIPIKELFQPAIKLAKEGVSLNKFQAYDLSLLQKIAGFNQRGREIYYKLDGVKSEGDLIQMENLADFLEVLGIEGKDLFYRGEIAKIIDEASQEVNGYITKADLEKYQVRISEPFSFKFNNYDIYTANGPSRGGAAMALMLKDVHSLESSIPLGIAKAQNILTSQVKLEQILSQEIGNHNFSLNTSHPSNKGTSHINIVDKKRNAISLTTSIGEGNGYFIPGTDMQLNNMLGEVFLLPDGPHSWMPATRLNSMMTPTLVFNPANKLFCVTGSGGASRIPYAIAQVLIQLIQKKKNLRESTKQGRYHFQDQVFQLEKGTSWDPQGLAHNHWTRSSLYFGGVHSIVIEKETIFAEGDQRRIGVAEVF